MTLSKIFIFLFLIEFTYQENEDFERCSSAERTKCKSVQISDKHFECCEAFVDYYGKTPDFYNC